MPIANTDIVYKLSTTAGTAGNQNTQVAGETSCGKYISTTAFVTNTLNNLFVDITGDENAAGQTDYQCLFVHNNHGFLTLQNAVIWINSQVSDGATMSIGVDPTGISAIGSSSAQAVTIADASHAPAGVTFTSPTTKSGGLSLGSIAAGSCIAVWIKRTISNANAVNNDGGILSVGGDTSA